MIPLLIYLWPNPGSASGKSILIRASYGNGIAIDAKCCCEECCCTDLPATLYAKIVHLVQDASCGASFERTDYFEFALAADEFDDGCACTFGTAGDCTPTYYHGIYSRDVCVFEDGGNVLKTADVHARLQCGGGSEANSLSFAISVDFYDAFTNTTSGVCNVCNLTGSFPCPIEYPISWDSDDIGCDIHELHLSSTPWS